MNRALAALTLCAGCFTKPPFDLQPRDADTVDVISDARVDALGGPNVAFVTSVAASIVDLGSAEAADDLCRTRAEMGGLPPNTYRAWLSTPMASAAERLGSARGWVRPDGRPFADTVAQLMAGEIYHPLRIDEFATDRMSVNVATATNEDGSLAANDCNGLSGTGEQIATGVSDATRKRWTDNLTPLACANDVRYYCLGIDHQTPVALVPSTGRRAFLSTASFLPDSSGILTADGICMSEAQGQGFSGQFAALLTTKNASASSRFDDTGQRWVRSDGVALSLTAADLMNGDVLTSLNVQADGVYVSDVLVWTGVEAGRNLKQVSLSACEDWTSTTLQAGVGLPVRSNNFWFRSGNLHDCDEPRRVYCLEQ